MTYRFGRTSKLRYAATVSGITTYQPGAPVARGYAAAPSPQNIPVGCHYDTKKGKIVCTDTGDPLAFPQQSTSGRAKPKRRGKKTRRYGKTAARRARRAKKAGRVSRERILGPAAGHARGCTDPTACIKLDGTCVPCPDWDPYR